MNISKWFDGAVSYAAGNAGIAMGPDDVADVSMTWVSEGIARGLEELFNWKTEGLSNVMLHFLTFVTTAGGSIFMPDRRTRREMSEISSHAFYAMLARAAKDWNNIVPSMSMAAEGIKRGDVNLFLTPFGTGPLQTARRDVTRRTPANRSPAQFGRLKEPTQPTAETELVMR